MSLADLGYFDEPAPKKKRASHRAPGGFLSGMKLLALVFFVFGLVIGAFLFNLYLDFSVNPTGAVAMESLQEINQELDRQVDSCFSCLNEKGFELDSCAEPEA